MRFINASRYSSCGTLYAATLYIVESFLCTTGRISAFTTTPSSFKASAFRQIRPKLMLSFLVLSSAVKGSYPKNEARSRYDVCGLRV